MRDMKGIADAAVSEPHAASVLCKPFGPLKEHKLVRLFLSGLEDDVQLSEMSKPTFSL